jgi:hypothetical protein
MNRFSFFVSRFSLKTRNPGSVMIVPTETLGPRPNLTADLHGSKRIGRGIARRVPVYRDAKKLAHYDRSTVGAREWWVTVK